MYNKLQELEKRVRDLEDIVRRLSFLPSFSSKLQKFRYVVVDAYPRVFYKEGEAKYEVTYFLVSPIFNENLPISKIFTYPISPYCRNYEELKDLLAENKVPIVSFHLTKYYEPIRIDIEEDDILYKLYDLAKKLKCVKYATLTPTGVVVLYSMLSEKKERFFLPLSIRGYILSYLYSLIEEDIEVLPIRKMRDNESTIITIIPFVEKVGKWWIPLNKREELLRKISENHAS